MDYYTRYESPLGPIVLSSDGTSLTGLFFEGQAHFGTTLGRDAKKAPLSVFTRTVRWLDLYFAGERPRFTPPVRFLGTPFQVSVWEKMREIPFGESVSYGQIASSLGSSPRAVGNAVARNPVSLVVPCHRVVGASGQLTGYAGGLARKQALLALEAGGGPLAPLPEVEAVYFDLDGVLADFDRGVAELCGMEPLPQSENTPPEAEAALWKAIRETPHFYARLEPVPGALSLFAALRARYGERCRILSGVPKPHKGVLTAEADKRDWVRRYLGEDVQVNLVLKEEKPRFCTGRQCLLIDDYEVNLRRWRASGGMDIPFADARSAERELRLLDFL